MLSMKWHSPCGSQPSSSGTDKCIYLLLPRVFSSTAVHGKAPVKELKQHSFIDDSCTWAIVPSSLCTFACLFSDCVCER